MITTTYHSPLGDVTLAADARGLTALRFADRAPADPAPAHDGCSFDACRGDFDEAARRPSNRVRAVQTTPSGLGAHIEGGDAVSGRGVMGAVDPEHAAAASVLERAWAWLNAYFAGQTPRWMPPLHFEGTEFQHAVWVALMEIPYGQTLTYAGLAQRIAARSIASGEGATAPSPHALAAAMRRNPIPIIVPCHRVIGADGSCAGYVGGAERKRALLGLEGACGR